MTNLMTQLLRQIFPRKKLTTRQARELLERDPSLRIVREEQRDVESRLRALEVQARVRARRG